ncbi:BTB/POZ domain-containing protein 3-like isoform X3 [Paramacrobiotus metropolitanus]|uniref:BTB/POZ domain-containing protein 3-like isoform X3 n=1 Tax=Paramacrobiotus metropolitanus TaxID=2943436 RepID=UPI002446515C|nr:BTB/POZ domain-containing protein 3-like isoform X3 [Paramacrobiotus metropolitanus]
MDRQHTGNSSYISFQDSTSAELHKINTSGVLPCIGYFASLCVDCESATTTACSNCFNRGRIPASAIMAQGCDSSVSSERRGAVPLTSSRWKNVLANSELTDVEFSVGRQCGEVKILRAHRLALSVGSDVFHTMFYGSLAEPTDKPIDIPEIPPDAFTNMLSYIYTDSVENLQPENVLQTLYCAEKYDLPWLTEICTDFVLLRLKPDNCLTYLENAVRWVPDCSVVIEKCLNLVDEFCAAVLQSKDWAKLERTTLEIVLQRDTLSADEIVIYLAVEKWAAAACARNNLDTSAANRREMLGPALSLVRFPLLTDAQLADGPIESGLLLLNELRDIYVHKHTTKLAKQPTAFRTDPRVYSVHRTDQSAFKHREKVFVRCPGGVGWYPAKVVGTRDGRMVLEWYSQLMKEKTAPPEDIIRAADILRRGRRIEAFDGSVFVEGTYGTRRATRHIANLAGSERSVEFADLIIPEKEAEQWITKTAAAIVN